MDTSETYIKMRLAAIPDLGMGPPPEVMAEYAQSTNIFIDTKGDWYYSTETEAVQLERQDQLQEMWLEYTKQSPIQLASCFGEHQYEVLFNNRIANLSFPTHKTSMEQLWLAFVMKEKYNKVWTGEDWQGD